MSDVLELMFSIQKWLPYAVLARIFNMTCGRFCTVSHTVIHVCAQTTQTAARNRKMDDLIALRVDRSGYGVAINACSRPCL